jgi:ArsR family transcriptional regulator
MMEREAILSCQTDERRRKYYYLANDILINVSLKHVQALRAVSEEDDAENEQLIKSVAMLGRMIRSHDQILTSLEQINHDIEIKITDLARNHKDLFRGDREITVIIALSHESLTLPELEQVTEVPHDELSDILKRFERKGIVGRTDDRRYTLRGVHAE